LVILAEDEQGADGQPPGTSFVDGSRWGGGAIADAFGTLNPTQPHFPQAHTTPASTSENVASGYFPSITSCCIRGESLSDSIVTSTGGIFTLPQVSHDDPAGGAEQVDRRRSPLASLFAELSGSDDGVWCVMVLGFVPWGLVIYCVGRT
jgi:hypothetical protein